jgi:hypothetical protein
MTGLLLLGLTLNPGLVHGSLIGFWILFVLLAAYSLKYSMMYVWRLEGEVKRLRRELEKAGADRSSIYGTGGVLGRR